MSASPPLPLMLSSSARPRLDVRLVVALGALYLIWGSTYLAMRVAVAGLPPFGMAGTRFVLAGGALLAITRARGETMPSLRAWLVAVPVGALLFLCGNGLVVVAEQTLPSSVAAVVCATTPLVASGLMALRGERPSRVEIIGMVLGIAGVGLLGLGSPLAVAGWRALLVLLAPIGWAIGSLVARSEAAKAGPASRGLGAAAAQMIMGGVWMLLMSLVLGEHLPTESRVGQRPRLGLPRRLRLARRLLRVQLAPRALAPRRRDELRVRQPRDRRAPRCGARRRAPRLGHARGDGAHRRWRHGRGRGRSQTEDASGLNDPRPCRSAFGL